ncbi:hypothetical protein AXE80_10875 [Wenyingzhuangia fucanilytica]|uniref:Uncharacterized protein n=1 Tax=Wenyingzhuangia fucanilytica TaxID=1790137 RepID=A0A1B1Y7L9_9FLAO|nr:hypothetical protein [Wenyingzhuangia fucanilytica]ANW96747.1 hypothetical protein AXE80_10875 [Wenyingzhuangia fucanilytica]
MLKINELSSFIEFVKTKIEFSDDLFIVDDKDFSKKSRDFKTTKIGLLVVIPSSSPNSKDVDQIEFKDLCSFYFLKKQTDNDGNKAFLEKLSLCQNKAIEFIELIQQIQRNDFGCIDGFEQIEFPTLDVNPVSNFNGYCGYSLDFSLINPI